MNPHGNTLTPAISNTSPWEVQPILSTINKPIFPFFSQLQGSVSTEGAFNGFSSSLTVNMDKFREQMTEDTKFGENKIVLTSGGVDMPEPIGLKLIPIFEALKSHFYTVSDARSLSACKHTASLLMTRRNNLEKVLKDYPKLKNTPKPVGKYVSVCLRPNIVCLISVESI